MATTLQRLDALCAGKETSPVRLAGPAPLPGPLTVKRRVSVRGAIMIGGQKIQVGLTHARKTAEVTVEADTYQLTVQDGINLTAPRTTSRDIRRHKASNYALPASSPC